jgi:hypothetical protein
MRYDILRQAALECTTAADFNMSFWDTCIGGKIIASKEPQFQPKTWADFSNAVEDILELQSEAEQEILHRLICNELDVSRERIVPLVEEYIKQFMEVSSEV